MRFTQYYYLLFIYIFFCVVYSNGLAAEVISKETISKEAMNDLEMANFLRTAQIIKTENTELGITKPKRLTLKRNNIIKRAIFKSFSTNMKITFGISRTSLINKADHFKNDMAAYEIDRILNLNMIPVTVLRTINGKKGVVQTWVENSIVKKKIYDTKSKELDVCPFKKQNSIMNIFDILIYNDDRNLGNVLYTIDDCRLWMIDHSQSFRIKNKRPFSLAKLKIRMSAEFAIKLARLNSVILQEKVGQYINKRQITFLLKRRDAILLNWRENGNADFRLN